MLQALSGPRNPVRARKRGIDIPMGGLDRRSVLASMPAQNSPSMLNMWFEQDRLVTRGGYSVYSDTSDTGHSIGDIGFINFQGESVRQLLLQVGDTIYNLGAGTPSTVKTGVSGQRFSYVNYKGKVHMVNGLNVPMDYDGSTFTNTAWTGPTLTSLSFVHVFKQRLFFIERNTQSFWYAGVGDVSGALSEFDVGDFLSRGGQLVALGSLTRDGGDGLDDLLCVFSSRGEVLVYQGTDPGSASDWLLVGRFDIGRLQSRFATINIGRDLIALTQDGIVSISDVLGRGRANIPYYEQSDRIQPRIADDVIFNTAGSAVSTEELGFRIVFNPTLNMLLFNITEQNETDAYQVALHTRNRGAPWAEFDIDDAVDWAVFGDLTIFAKENGVTYQFYNGSDWDDNGSKISYHFQTAWTYLGDRASQKHVGSVQVVFDDGADGSGNELGSIGILTDFEPYANIPTANEGQIRSRVTHTKSNIYHSWYDVQGDGFAISLVLEGLRDETQLSFYALSVSYQVAPGV